MVRSWTIVDYYLRRTPAFWPVRRGFRPTTVALAAERDKVRVFGINEGPTFRGSLRFGLFALAGELPMDETIEVELPVNASTPLAQFPLSQLKRAGLRSHGAFAILLDASSQGVGRDKLLMPRFVEMDWRKAQVRVSVSRGRATFRSDAFAWRICLDLDGKTALPDNFLDVLPGIPTLLDWPGSLGPPRVVRVSNPSCQETA
jgi:beta-mannosidase